MSSRFISLLSLAHIHSNTKLLIAFTRLSQFARSLLFTPIHQRHHDDDDDLNWTRTRTVLLGNQRAG